LRKTLYSLFESGRGYLDLQLSYSSFGTLLFKNWELFVLKQGISKIDSCRPRSAPRHRAHTPATPGHANRVYLSTAARPARPCRAALAVRRHGCHRHLGELLLAPSTKLCTHAYPFLVTYNTSPRRALRRPRRRLASSQAASAGAAQHRRSSPPAPLHSRLRPRLGRR
jgi:hypothetical protein